MNLNLYFLKKSLIFRMFVKYFFNTFKKREKSDVQKAEQSLSFSIVSIFSSYLRNQTLSCNKLSNQSSPHQPV